MFNTRATIRVKSKILSFQNMDIKKIREKIDKIDCEILELLKERFDFMPDVVEYKIKNNLEIFDDIREKEVLKNKEVEAKKKEINPEFIKNIYQEIMDESKKIQKQYVKEKK